MRDSNTEISGLETWSLRVLEMDEEKRISINDRLLSEKASEDNSMRFLKWLAAASANPILFPALLLVVCIVLSYRFSYLQHSYSDSVTLSQLKQRGFTGLLPKPYSRHAPLSIAKAAISRT